MKCQNCNIREAEYNYGSFKCCHNCLMEHFNDNPEEREYFMENQSLEDIKIS